MRFGLRKLSLSGLMVLVGTLALLVAGCGTPTSTGPSNLAKNQVLHMIWATGGGPDIITMDPAQAGDSGSIPLVEMVFDGLVTLDKNLNVEPWGADKFTVSSDGLTYTFHIRAGQKFSDGTPVNASDFAYSINRTLNPCVVSGVASYLYPIKDAATFNGETCNTDGTLAAASGQTTPVIQTLVGDSVVADDTAETLTITLEAPAAVFLTALTYPTSYAIEQKAVTGANMGADDKWLDNLKTGATGEGGSGMFYVSQWNHTGDMVLKANPNWWGRNAGKKPYLTEIDLKMFSDVDTGYNTYQSNQQYDVYPGGNSIPATQLAAAKQQPDFHQNPELAVASIAMNWNVAPFDNINARKAFCLALNRDAIVKNVLKNASQPSWHLLPSGMPGYNASLQGIDGAPTSGDTAKALQYWNQYKASLNGKPVPAITYNFNNSGSTAELYAEAIQGQINAALPGANVLLDSKDWKSAVKLESSGRLQMYRWGWIADYPDPQDFLSLLYATGSTYNWVNASDTTADGYMKQADGMSDPSKASQRMSLYNQAEQSLVNSVANCPLYQYVNHYRVRSWVNGYVESAQSQLSLDAWSQVYIQNH